MDNPHAATQITHIFQSCRANGDPLDRRQHAVRIVRVGGTAAMHTFYADRLKRHGDAIQQLASRVEASGADDPLAKQIALLLLALDLARQCEPQSYDISDDYSPPQIVIK